MNKYKLEVNTDKTENLPEEINIIDFKLIINEDANEDININYEIDNPDKDINVLDNTITTNNKFIDTIKLNNDGKITGQITINKANNTALLQVATNHSDYFIKNGNKKGVTIKFFGENLIEDVTVTGYIKYEKPVIKNDILIKNSKDDFNHGYKIRIYDNDDITVGTGSTKSNMTVSIKIDEDSQNYTNYKYDGNTIDLISDLNIKTNDYNESLENELTNFNHVMKEKKDNYEINYTNNTNFKNLKKNITNYTKNTYNIKVNSISDERNVQINEILEDKILNEGQINNIQEILLANPHHAILTNPQIKVVNNVLANKDIKTNSLYDKANNIDMRAEITEYIDKDKDVPNRIHSAQFDAIELELKKNTFTYNTALEILNIMNKNTDTITLGDMNKIKDIYLSKNKLIESQIIEINRKLNTTVNNTSSTSNVSSIDVTFNTSQAQSNPPPNVEKDNDPKVSVTLDLKTLNTYINDKNETKLEEYINQIANHYVDSSTTTAEKETLQEYINVITKHYNNLISEILQQTSMTDEEQLKVNIYSKTNRYINTLTSIEPHTNENYDLSNISEQQATVIMEQSTEDSFELTEEQINEINNQLQNTVLVNNIIDDLNKIITYKITSFREYILKNNRNEYWHNLIGSFDLVKYAEYYGIFQFKIKIIDNVFGNINIESDEKIIIMNYFPLNLTINNNDKTIETKSDVTSFSRETVIINENYFIIIPPDFVFEIWNKNIDNLNSEFFYLQSNDFHIVLNKNYIINYGTINVKGSLLNSGYIINYGTINNCKLIDNSFSMSKHFYKNLNKKYIETLLEKWIESQSVDDVLKLNVDDNKIYQYLINIDVHDLYKYIIEPNINDIEEYKYEEFIIEQEKINIVKTLKESSLFENIRNYYINIRYEFDNSYTKTNEEINYHNQFLKIINKKNGIINNKKSATIKNVDESFVNNNEGNIIHINSTYYKYGPIENWDTSNINDMSSLFKHGRRNTHNTSLINNTESLIIDTSSWNTFNVTNFTDMFHDASAMNKEYPETIDLTNIKNRISFYGIIIVTNELLKDIVDEYLRCRKKSIYYKYIELLDTSSVTDMSNLFAIPNDEDPIINKNIDIDISRWNIKNVTDFTDIFKGATFTNKKYSAFTDEQKSVSVKTITNDNKYYLFKYYFYNNQEIKTAITEYFNNKKDNIKIYGPIENWNTIEITNMTTLLKNKDLTDIDLSEWDVSNVTNMHDMFMESTNTNTINISKWNVSNVTDMSRMFSYCDLTDIDLYEWDVSNVTNMHDMFMESKNTNTINISKWNVSNVTDMSRMFSNCDIDTDLSEWDVSNVTDMYAMFDNCKTFNQTLNSWNVSNVTDMSRMFSNCDKYNNGNTKLIWNTSKVLDFSNMFLNSTSFNQDIEFKNLKRDYNNGEDVKYINMAYMFKDAINFNNILTFDVSQVNNMESMFNNCKKFNQNISEWSTSSVVNINNMFGGCSVFNQDLTRWDVKKVENGTNIFYNCTDMNLYQPNSRPSILNKALTDYFTGEGAKYNEVYNLLKDGLKIEDYTHGFSIHNQYLLDVNRYGTKVKWNKIYKNTLNEYNPIKLNNKNYYFYQHNDQLLDIWKTERDLKYFIRLFPKEDIYTDGFLNMKDQISNFVEFTNNEDLYNEIIENWILSIGTYNFKFVKSDDYNNVITENPYAMTFPFLIIETNGLKIPTQDDVLEFTQNQKKGELSYIFNLNHYYKATWKTKRKFISEDLVDNIEISNIDTTKIENEIIYEGKEFIKYLYSSNYDISYDNIKIKEIIKNANQNEKIKNLKYTISIVIKGSEKYIKKKQLEFKDKNIINDGIALFYDKYKGIPYPELTEFTVYYNKNNINENNKKLGIYNLLETNKTPYWYNENYVYVQVDVSNPFYIYYDRGGWMWANNSINNQYPWENLELLLPNGKGKDRKDVIDIIETLFEYSTTELPSFDYKEFIVYYSTNSNQTNDNTIGKYTILHKNNDINSMYILNNNLPIYTNGYVYIIYRGKWVIENSIDIENLTSTTNSSANIEKEINTLLTNYSLTYKEYNDGEFTVYYKIDDLLDTSNKILGTYKRDTSFGNDYIVYKQTDTLTEEINGEDNYYIHINLNGNDNSWKWTYNSINAVNKDSINFNKVSHQNYIPNILKEFGYSTTDISFQKEFTIFYKKSDPLNNDDTIIGNYIIESMDEINNTPIYFNGNVRFRYNGTKWKLGDIEAMEAGKFIKTSTSQIINTYFDYSIEEFSANNKTGNTINAFTINYNYNVSLYGTKYSIISILEKDLFNEIEYIKAVTNPNNNTNWTIVNELSTNWCFKINQKTYPFYSIENKNDYIEFYISTEFTKPNNNYITFVTDRNIDSKEKYDNEINDGILIGKNEAFTKEMNVIKIGNSKNKFWIYKTDFISEMNYINDSIVLKENYVNKSFADELKTNWVIKINDILFKFINVIDDDVNNEGGYYEFTTHTSHNLNYGKYNITFYTSRKVEISKDKYLENQLSGTEKFTKKINIHDYVNNSNHHIAIGVWEIGAELSIFIDNETNIGSLMSYSITNEKGKEIANNLQQNWYMEVVGKVTYDENDNWKEVIIKYDSPYKYTFNSVKYDSDYFMILFNEGEFLNDGDDAGTYQIKFYSDFTASLEQTNTLEEYYKQYYGGGDMDGDGDMGGGDMGGGDMGGGDSDKDIDLVVTNIEYINGVIKFKIKNNGPDSTTGWNGTITFDIKTDNDGDIDVLKDEYKEVTLNDGKLDGGEEEQFEYKVPITLTSGKYKLYIDNPFNDVNETDENNNFIKFDVPNSRNMNSRNMNSRNMYSTNNTRHFGSFFNNIFNTSNNKNTIAVSQNQTLNKLRRKKNIY